MTQVPRIPVLLPLAVGAVVILCTFLIHALSVSVSLNLLRRERRLGRTGRSFWSDFPVVVLAMLATLTAHLIEIALWAEVFVLCGEFPYFGTAYYHSAVNYTTLGYGDLVMTPHWRFLGPLEAANGMLLFGVSTAMVFALIQWLIEARFTDLRE
jgi:Ion channel